MKRLSLTAFAVILACNLIGITHSAKADDFDPDNLDILCENSPFNSRCADWEPLVTLEERPGEKTNCQVAPVEVELNGLCKLSFVDGNIVAYIEHSRPEDRPTAFGGKKNTLMVTVPQDQVFVRTTSETAILANQGTLSKVLVELGFVTSSDEESPNRTRFLSIATSKENLLEQLDNISLPDLASHESRADFSDTVRAMPIRSVDNVSRLLETNECVRCDLSGADLSGADLAAANLEGANLTNADLSEANLTGAYLVSANLEGADLTDARLDTSILALSSFSEATNFEDASLSSAALVLADLRGTRIKEAVLTPLGTSVSPVVRAATVLAYSDLSSVDLSEAELNGVNFIGSNLKNANLSNASLNPFSVAIPAYISYGADRIKINYYFKLQARFGMSNLQGANFSGASLKLASLEIADLSNANLTAADFDRAYLVNANLSNALLQDTLLTTINMSGANFTGTDLSSSDLEGSTFCNTTMPSGAVSNDDCER